MKWKEIIHQIEASESSQPYLLRLFINELRQSDKQEFHDLLIYLEQNKSQCLALSNYIYRTFEHKNIVKALTESGIFKNTGFGSEIFRRMKHSILPELEPKQNLNYIIAILFPGRNDDRWLSSIDRDSLVTLFTLLKIEVDFSTHHMQSQLVDSIRILSHRIAATALETEFIHTFRDNETLENFIGQNNEVATFVAQINLGVAFNPHLAEHIIQLSDHALKNIQSLMKLSARKGTSLQLTYILHRLTRQIERLKLLFGFYLNPRVKNIELIDLLTTLLVNEKSKNRVRVQLNETIYLMAYQIAEHESKTGEHYIAENRKEYLIFLKSSCKGGVIAAVMAFFKIILHHLHFAPFWQAFAYSINYAAGFIAIQVSHSILATKQPAMTASTIARSLDKENTDEGTIQSLALIIGKVSRSQFISFVGNLILVFPLSFCIAWGYYFISGQLLMNEAEAKNMMHDVHPWLNPTWYYACITGVFLFLSGIISGYYDNKVIYSQLHLRMREHAFLKRILTKRALIKFSRYVEYNLGSLIGNIALGFFLGTAGFWGFIFGIPFDIRHITISASNYSIALFTLGTTMEWKDILICLIGVLGIGFFNFMISFGLAIFVASKSRRIKNTQFDDLIKWVWIYLKKYPRDFIRPPKEERTIHDLVSK